MMSSALAPSIGWGSPPPPFPVGQLAFPPFGPGGVVLSYRNCVMNAPPRPFAPLGRALPPFHALLLAPQSKNQPSACLSPASRMPHYLFKAPLSWPEKPLSPLLKGSRIAKLSIFLPRASPPPPLGKIPPPRAYVGTQVFPHLGRVGSVQPSPGAATLAAETARSLPDWGRPGWGWGGVCVRV